MFISRLKELIVSKGITQKEFLLEVGLNKNAIRNWELHNNLPSLAVLTAMANYFNVSVAYLKGETDTPTPITSNAIPLSPERYHNIPLYESVSAGFGAMAQDLVVDCIPLYIHDKVEAADTICIKVTGDSMSPQIEDGDIIQVHKQDSVDSGSIAVVLVDGDEALVKKVEYSPSHIELQSINPKYPTLRFEATEPPRVSVVGLVRQILKRPDQRAPLPSKEQQIHDALREMSSDQLDQINSYIQFIKSQKK